MRIDPATSAKAIGEFLRSARRGAGKTQLDVARVMRVSTRQIRHLEAGDGKPTLTALARFVQAVGGTLGLEMASDAHPAKGRRTPSAAAERARSRASGRTDATRHARRDRSSTG
jgi:transcriptional regulator with XRE-family HTH domain